MLADVERYPPDKKRQRVYRFKSFRFHPAPFRDVFALNSSKFIGALTGTPLSANKSASFASTRTTSGAVLTNPLRYSKAQAGNCPITVGVWMANLLSVRCQNGPLRAKKKKPSLP